MTSVCYPTFQINFPLGFTWLPHKASEKGQHGGQLRKPEMETGRFRSGPRSQGRAVGPWTGYLISLGLGFLICKLVWDYAVPKFSYSSNARILRLVFSIIMKIE